MPKRRSCGPIARLASVLDDGPAGQGWSEDQRWTLARITRLIGRLFHVSYTLRGTSYLTRQDKPCVPRRARTWSRRGHTPVIRVSGKDRVGYRSQAWSATNPATAATCSTGYASTAAARANTAASARATTPPCSPPHTSNYTPR